MAETTKPPRLTLSFQRTPPEPEGADPMLRALTPVPEGRLTLTEPKGPTSTGQTFGPFDVWSAMDLPGDDTIRVFSIEQDVMGKPMAEWIARVREQITLLAPDLPEDLLPRLTARQLLKIAEESAGGKAASPVDPPPGGRASA